MTTQQTQTLEQLEKLVGGKTHEVFTPQVEALVGSSDAYALLFQDPEAQRVYREIVDEHAVFQEWREQGSPGDVFYPTFLKMATYNMEHLLRVAEERGAVAAYRLTPASPPVMTHADKVVSRVMLVRNLTVEDFLEAVDRHFEGADYEAIVAADMLCYVEITRRLPGEVERFRAAVSEEK